MSDGISCHKKDNYHNIMENKPVEREELIEKCAGMVLTAIISGNLKQTVAEVIEKVLLWQKDRTFNESNTEVLLNETKIEPTVKEQVATEDQKGVRPAPLYNSVTSSVAAATRPAPVGNTTSTGWSNPFKGTSWGV